MKFSFLILMVAFVATSVAQTLRDQLAKGKVILCAHRGGMYEDYAENSLRTLAYLERKFGSNPIMAEVDVRKSKDGTLFLLHDNTLERTTNGSGAIEDQTDVYLKSLKLKNRRGEITDEGIPTLTELLRFVSKRNIFLMLDVKIDDWKVILDAVRAENMISRCLVLTFKPENSRKVHELAPDVFVSCLVKDQKDFDEIKKIVSKDVLLAYVNKTTPDDVVKQMKIEKIPLVSDASEETTNNFKPYSADHYRAVIDRGINVYVTDLPVEVSKLILN